MEILETVVEEKKIKVVENVGVEKKVVVRVGEDNENFILL
jgi:hypothetical protein